MYRPNTKRGDPRIWFTNIKEYVAPESLMALFIRDDKLYILNCSNSRLYQNFITNSRLLALVTDQTNQLSQAANELLNKMKAISSNGFIKTMRAGDTGVGFTLESLLGIQANSSKAPDFKGIEIKSIRKRNKKGTLLSMVPDWVNSNIKDANELVLKRGHINSSKGNLKTIFHSIDAVKPNSYNLQLKLDDLWIHQIHKLNNISEKDVRWSIQALAERLAAKHKETFWVDTETRLSNAGEEEFLYKAVIHTSKIDIHSIPELIEQGSINIDYLLWEKRKDWKTYVNKRGFDFLWKIKMKDRDLLFKSVNKFPLS